MDTLDVVLTNGIVSSTLLCEMAVEIIGKSFVTFVYWTFLQGHRTRFETFQTNNFS